VSALAVMPFDPAESWPEPDARLLNGGARPAPAFPLATLGPLATYVGDLAAAKDGPPDYLALALLTTAAGVIGGARAVQLRHNWIAPCILWGLLVGNPSTGKSQPLEVLKRAVRAIEPDDAPDFSEVHRAWQTAAATAKEVETRWLVDVKAAVKDDHLAPLRPSEADIPSEPLRPRILIGSATVEKLGHMFAAFPRGLMLHMDEGAAWFGNFGKYGGDGDAAFFLSAFDGIGTTVDRVREGGSVAPDRALLSACVGIQPERLNELLLNGRSDDGLVGRFLPVWPDPVAPMWNTPQVDEGRLEGLLRRLRALKPSDLSGRPVPVVMPLTPEAEALFATWWTEAKHKAQGASGLLAGFLGKGLGVAGRLALVIELLTWAATGGPEPTSVSALSVAAALTLFEDYFAPMAGRVYGDAARPVPERAAVVLLKAVQARKARTLNKREVYRDWGLSGLTTAKQVQAALDVLEEGDCIQADPTVGAKGGRPSGDYLVNPRIFGALG
jgi:hypothetical protein